MFHDWSFVVKYSVLGPLRIKEIHYKICVTLNQI